MNNPTEIELKLLIDPADIPKLRRHPLLKSLCAAGPKTRKLTSIYFDSDDFVLKNQAIALRVRRSGRQWIQTVKSGGNVKGGLHQRDEWETPVASSTPDYSRITAPDLLPLFSSEQLQQRLHPLFVTEFKRTIWLLETKAGDQVEMALDQGVIRTEHKSAPICEVELELKKGNPALLYELALALQEAAPLCPENSSKAERGYALCTQQDEPQQLKASVPEITREMTVEEAFRSIAWNCIDQLQNNRNRLQQGYDPELVHQMRVALRRLRSALSLFSAAAPGIKDASLSEGLSWLACQLGQARDLDVFINTTLPPVLAAMPADKGLHYLQQQAVKISREKHEQACDASAGRRYNEIMLKLGAWLWHAPWRTTAVDAELDMQVPVFAAQMLEQRYRRVRRQGRRFKSLTSEQRHMLRITTKKLRYAAEFFSGLYPGKVTRQYIKALSKLQDGLGTLNDQAVAVHLLQQLLGDERVHDHTIGLLSGWCASKTAHQLADMTQAWKHFKPCRIFWDKL